MSHVVDKITSAPATITAGSSGVLMGNAIQQAPSGADVNAFLTQELAGQIMTYGGAALIIIQIICWTPKLWDALCSWVEWWAKHIKKWRGE